MKISKFIASLIVAGTLFAPIVACAEDKGSGASVGEFVKDSAITTQIKAKLLAAKDIDSLHITVDTDNSGIVVLNGAVKSEIHKRQVGEIAVSVDGVKQVINNLRIDPFPK